jgi:tetratricopeptide repeat protein
MRVADYVASAVMLRDAAERALALFGPDHPNLARILNNLGNVQRDHGDLVGAEASLSRAFAI